MGYDSFTITALLHLEDLGFCAKGEGGPFVADGRTGPGGSLPMNTNGGGLSYTHPGMYGMFLIVEAVRQLRGEADARQVPGAEIAVAHGSGMVLSCMSTLVLGTEADPMRRADRGRPTSPRATARRPRPAAAGGAGHRGQRRRSGRPPAERRWSCPGASTCDQAFWFPREVCPRCLGSAIEWRPASGRGVVYAVTVDHRPALLPRGVRRRALRHRPGRVWTRACAC